VVDTSTRGLERPLVDYRPVERLKLPARLDDNRGHVYGGEVIKMTPADDNRKVDECVPKSGIPVAL
jgi:hypothetical protein